MSSEGLLLVISGPSGCGKGTVCELLKQRNPDMRVSVSATTRDIRRGEREGVTYFYKTKQQFEEMIQRDSCWNMPAVTAAIITVLRKPMCRNSWRRAMT